jgi:hypothetical protein
VPPFIRIEKEDIHLLCLEQRRKAEEEPVHKKHSLPFRATSVKLKVDSYLGSKSIDDDGQGIRVRRGSKERQKAQE